MSDGHRNVVNR